jgi:hypothetical protein
MRYKVIAMAHYEYEVEADDDELAVEKAMWLLDESMASGSLGELLEWEAVRDD